MLGNSEQCRVIREVGNHLLNRENKQLLMYVSGIGGTGKSHVIRGIISLFRLAKRSHNLLLSAPTGAAAILISGYTIHSLTFLPKS
ncbi:hypothetical protein CALVIDRAFT_483783, partial [Calocera viscosa TUFC12733]